MTWYRGFYATAAALALSAVLSAQAAEVASSASVGFDVAEKTRPAIFHANRDIRDRCGRRAGDQRVEGAGAIENTAREARMERSLCLWSEISKPPVARHKIYSRELHDKLAAYMAVPEVAVTVQEVKEPEVQLYAHCSRCLHCGKVCTSENNPPKPAARLPTAVLPPVSTVGATISAQTTVKVHLSFGLVPNVSCHSEALFS